MAKKKEVNQEEVIGTYVPSVNPLYVKWGEYETVEKIVKSNMFCTMFITGLSGNGKTMMVEQACAHTGRKYVRLNVTMETDEDDLFGGFRLVNGETEWFDGPVVKAMEEGAVLLLDEVDLGSPRIMALQPVLEGKPLFLKKVGRVVYPKEGFNIIATANTKGQGDSEGKFVGTNVLNEAFLERFSLTFEQPYPNIEQEGVILDKLFAHHKINNNNLRRQLLEFVDYTRKAYESRAVTDLITTRRLEKIVLGYSIFKDVKKALGLCLNRFDDQTKEAFLEFFNKLEDPDHDLNSNNDDDVIDATSGNFKINI